MDRRSTWNCYGAWVSSTGVLAAVLWLVGALLCVTVILIPLGIPVVRLVNCLSALPGS